jgi:hypothetical protein
VISITYRHKIKRLFVQLWGHTSIQERIIFFKEGGINKNIIRCGIDRGVVEVQLISYRLNRPVLRRRDMSKIVEAGPIETNVEPVDSFPKYSRVRFGLVYCG